MRPTLFNLTVICAIITPCAVPLNGLTTSVVAQEATLKNATRSDFVSPASFIVGTFQPQQGQHSPAAMTKAASAFIDALTPGQRAIAVLDLKNRERREWTNLPARRDAGGIAFRRLSENQTQLACQLMATLMSKQGYNKVRNIMLADDQLLRGGKPRDGFGTANFALVIFGSPSETTPWAVQIDGHHVGVNLAIEGDSITMSPSFIGTQPSGFEIAGVTIKPLKNETDMAHAIAESLTDSQIKSALLNKRRSDLITGPGRDGFVPDALGVSCSTFDADQKGKLIELIGQWVNDLPPAQAAQRMKQIESEIDQMKFSWNGNTAPGSDVSYRIQSPSLIIEYACQDLGGQPLEHLHSNYRNPHNEYGKQLESN